MKSRLTQPASTAKSNHQRTKSGRPTTALQTPNHLNNKFAATHREYDFSRTQNFDNRSGHHSRQRFKSQTEKSLDLSQISNPNPMLKPGVTAEDLANRLMSHKLKAENKIRLKQQQEYNELMADRRPQTNTNKNAKLVADQAPIHNRVDKIISQK